MLHARVIPAGKCLYAIGHAGKLLVAKSTDNGETCGDPPLGTRHPGAWQESNVVLERNPQIEAHPKSEVPLPNFKKRIPGPPFFAGDPGKCFSGKTQIRV